MVSTSNRRRQSSSAAKARRWALRLGQRVQSVLAAHPQADPDNVRHTLILLEQPPLERLQRGLIRGRHKTLLLKIPLGRHKLKVLSLERILASKLAANRPKDQLTIPVLRHALAATRSVKPPRRGQRRAA
jgi:hypothetical protein